MKLRDNKFFILLILQGGVLLYSLASICGKFASRYDFLSWGFIVCYGLEIVVLGLYALLWQQIIKRVDISVAYANRAVAIFYSMIWAVLVFRETVSLNNIIGVCLIFVGTWMVNNA